MNVKKLTLCVLLFIGLVPVSNAHAEDLSIFLKPTKYIDCDNETIIAKAKELTKNCTSEIEKLKAIFEFVRDSNTPDILETAVASEVLLLGGNSCYQRAVLLAALCRAVNIPARLQYQKLLLRNFTVNGVTDDYLYTHGLTGIYVEGSWHLYEPVGNNAKWMIWTEQEELKSDMTVQFEPNKDCLFPSTDKVYLETIPVYFADYDKDRYSLMRKFATGENGLNLVEN